MKVKQCSSDPPIFLVPSSESKVSTSFTRVSLSSGFQYYHNTNLKVSHTPYKKV